MENPDFEITNPLLKGGKPQEVGDISQENEVKEKAVFRLGVSPTGSDNKRLGGIRTHLYNYAFAKSEKEKGVDSSIIYRVDDTNKETQSREKTLSDYKFFSETLGFDFDVTPYNSEERIGQSVFQSEKRDIYMRYLEPLFDKHIAFVDKNSGLTLFDIERFMSDYTETIEINELLRGKIKFRLEEHLKRGMKFFPLIRSDKSVLYNFATVIDDAVFGVTHVVRGEDKIPIIDFQEMIRIALELQPKKHLHTPMLLIPTDAIPQRHSKFGNLLREGILPHALVSYMISSGYGNPDDIYSSMSQFIHDFDYKKIHKSSGYFDIRRLENINKKLIKGLSKEVFVDSLLLYLAKNNEDQLVHELGETQLVDIMSSIRRIPVESRKILKDIFNPEHEPLVSKLKPVVGYLLNQFKKTPDRIPKQDEFGFDKRQFFTALQWTLVGKYSFPQINKVFDFLKNKGLLSSRLEIARQEFIK